MLAYYATLYFRPNHEESKEEQERTKERATGTFHFFAAE